MSDPVIPSHNKKCFSNPADLVPVLEEHRKAGRKVVFANGCFEILHVGHLRYLFGAKALGDILVVAINTDESIKRIKPDRNPVNPDYERMEIISAIEAVDYVVPLEDNHPGPLCALLKPDIHTKGTDYADRLEQMPEYPIVKAYGGDVVTVGDSKDHSTTDILAKLKK